MSLRDEAEKEIQEVISKIEHECGLTRRLTPEISHIIHMLAGFIEPLKSVHNYIKSTETPERISKK